MSRNEQQSGSDTANVAAAMGLCFMIVVLMFVGFRAYERRPDKDPDKRPVEVRMEEFYGVSFEVLEESRVHNAYTFWELRSSDGIECSVVQCRESYGGVTTVRCYDTYCAERSPRSDAARALDASDGVHISLHSLLYKGGMGRDLPAYEWLVQLQDGADEAAVYALIDEAIAAAEMTADDIYRSEYWRSLPPVFVVYDEPGKHTVVTLKDRALL